MALTKGRRPDIKHFAQRLPADVGRGLDWRHRDARTEGKSSSENG